MFSYYGSKYRLSGTYPGPINDLIIEPFAGSACYSLYWSNTIMFKTNVILYDINPIICEIWDYLINVKESEILRLPELKHGEKIPVNICQGAKYLIGFWVSKAATMPRLSMTNKSHCDVKGNLGFWSAQIKQRIANQLQFIRHWKIFNDCYSNIPNRPATWYIDPPYQESGEHYKYSDIDYNHLGQWSRSRSGRSIVCEHNQADWLPFKTLSRNKGMLKNNVELIYTQDNNGH